MHLNPSLTLEPPHDQAWQHVYQFIRSLASISGWKSGTTQLMISKLLIDFLEAVVCRAVCLKLSTWVISHSNARHHGLV
jgi:hypothetical protein